MPIDDHDLMTALDDHLRSLLPDRGDESFAHVSDCFGCDRATWERRRGAPAAPRSFEQNLKMQLGVMIEQLVGDALQKAYEARGYRVLRNLRIGWNPEMGRAAAFKLEEGEDCTALVGHIDFEATNFGNYSRVVLEIKSTSFLKGKVPQEASPHAVEQAATYGIAVGATKCGVLTVCRESGRIAPIHWLDLDALAFATIERAKAVLRNTDPESFPPQPEPRYSWQPRYCALGQGCACARVNAERMVAR